MFCLSRPYIFSRFSNELSIECWIASTAKYSLLRSFIVEHSKNNMEPVNLGYSTKNIPIVQPKEYLKCLVEKTESFLRRVRWKAYHFLKPTQPEAAKETFGFNTTKSPPPIKELEAFESKMLSLVQRVQFKTHHNKFQNDLSQDLTKIRMDDTTVCCCR